MGAVGSDPLSCFILRAKSLRSHAFWVWGVGLLFFFQTLTRIAHLWLVVVKLIIFSVACGLWILAPALLQIKGKRMH